METKDLPLEGHLEELRTRLLICLIPAALLLFPLLVQSDYLLRALYDPLTRLGITVYGFQITDGLVLRLRIALTTDLILLLPLMLWQGYVFMRPGLYSSERTVMLPFLVIDTVLFYGVLYLFFTKLTPALASNWYRSQTISVVISAERYFSIWQAAALIVSLIIALLPVVMFLIWRMKNWRKRK